MQSSSVEYIGRFAPSPTGPLHFGSLVAALASYADAKRHCGKWLVRMEDIDRPRCMPGADVDILKMLRGFGFAFQEPILYQSRRTEAYVAALDRLFLQGLVYGCSCSRKDVGPIYSGTCRNRNLPMGAGYSTRVRVDDRDIVFEDRHAGVYRQNLAREVGDFVLRRADGLFTYQLAVVVDDAEQSVTDVVRGADLLDSTPRQMFLQQLLGYLTPRYLHFPVVTDANGEKLSKQTLAPALDLDRKEKLLEAAKEFLQRVLK